MSGTPWIKFYSSDWLAGTSGLTAAERGVYITICALIYEFDGPIPLDEARLARRCGCPKGPFRKILKALVDEKKLTVSLGMIDNEKCAIEIAERKKTSERQSLVARARWSEQDEKTVKKQASKNATGMPPECLPEPEPESEGSANALPKRASARGGSKLPDGFAEFWDLVPVKAGKPKCIENFRKAVKAGANPGDIIAGMRRYRDWLEAMGSQAPKTKYPQGWLTDERWNDELPDPSKTRSNGNGRTTLRTIAGWFPDDGQRQVDSDQGGIVAGQQLPDDGRGNAAGDRERLGDGPAGLPAPHPRSGIHGPSKVIDFPAETCGNYSAGLFKTLG